MGRTYQTIGVTLTPADTELLDRLADRYTGGNRSLMVRKALQSLNAASAAAEDADGFNYDAFMREFGDFVAKQWLLPTGRYPERPPSHDAPDADPPLSPKERRALERVVGAEAAGRVS